MARRRNAPDDNPYRSAEDVDSEADSREDGSDYRDGYRDDYPDDYPDDGPLAERRLALEEARLDLEREESRHRMRLDLMREKFSQSQAAISDEVRLRDSQEHWMKQYWRPAMGWLYMAICAFDFIIAPILAMLMPIYLKMLGETNVTYVPWRSITLENGGLIHLAFGAILGIAAWTRGAEKIEAMKGD